MKLSSSKIAERVRRLALALNPHKSKPTPKLNEDLTNKGFKKASTKRRKHPSRLKEIKGRFQRNNHDETGLVNLTIQDNNLNHITNSTVQCDTNSSKQNESEHNYKSSCTTTSSCSTSSSCSTTPGSCE